MDRRLLGYLVAVVGAFAILGAGLGLATNFTLGFFIEQFVEPGTDPLDVTQVGMLFLVSILLVYVLGPVAAAVAGIAVGQALPDRETTAGLVAGAGSFVGYFLYVGLALFLTFSVLAEYGTGGGGGGGPLDPASLGWLVVQVSLPTGLVGLATAYLTSRISGTGGRDARVGTTGPAGPSGRDTPTGPDAASGRDTPTGPDAASGRDTASGSVAASGGPSEYAIREGTASHETTRRSTGPPAANDGGTTGPTPGPATGDDA